jgi:hypothetical protein
VSHAGRITAPRGWELVRHAGPLATATNPDEDDLIALAEAVREGRDVAAGGAAVNGFHEPAGQFSAAPAEAPAAAVLTSTTARPAGNGRRRGHLRVLPDPSE